MLSFLRLVSQVSAMFSGLNVCGIFLVNFIHRCLGYPRFCRFVMWSLVVLWNVVTLEFDLRNLWHSPVMIAFFTCLGWFEE